MSLRSFCLVCSAPVLATVRPASAETLWVPAQKAQKLAPTMYLGRALNLQEENLLGDFIAPTVVSDPAKPDAESYAEFTVDAPCAGTYYVWARVRYPMGRGDSFGFSLLSGGVPGPVQALADGEQPDRAWRWASQAANLGAAAGSGRLKIELPQGPLTFRITARGARASVFFPHHWRWTEAAFNPHLNFLCLTSDARYVPTDADASKASGVNLTRRLPEPRVPPLELKRLSPAEWQAGDRQPIPDWMRCPRWYTKDSWRQEIKTRAAGDIAKLVRQVAACHGNVLRLSVMFAGEAFYQSRVAPHVPGLGDMDYLREAIDAGRRHGVKIVIYLWPWGLCVDNPIYQECVIRDPGGEIPARADYKLCDFDAEMGFVCCNSPAFRKFYRDVLTEIFTAYKPDGMYVDGLTPNFCFCQHCRAKYRQMFGAQMPVEKISKFYWPVTYWGALTSAPFLIGDPHDPEAHRFTAMMGRCQTEITQLFTASVKSCKPDAATTYHSYPKADNVQFYDGTLTEIYARRPWEHSAWSFGEVANYSNVFPVPVMSNVYPHDNCIAAEARCKALQALANGTFPNYWSTLEMAPVCGFIERNAEYFDFARTTPNKFITLARDYRLDTAGRAMKSPRGVSYPRDRFLAPAVGAYSAIVRSGLTLSTIHRLSLERQMRGTRVLVLANAALLGDEQVETIREFVRQGGGLIATHETSLYDANGTQRDDFALADLFGAHYVDVRPAAQRTIRVSAATHPVTAGLRGADLVHDEPSVSVRPDTAEVLAWLKGAKKGEAESPAILVHRFGRGQVVYLPGRPDSIQCATLTPWIERLYAAAIRWAGGEEPPVVVRASAMVGGTLFDQPDRRILHLLNHNRDSKYYGAQLTPLKEVAFDVAIPAGRQVRRVHRLWTPAELPFTCETGRVRFILPSLDEYEVVAVELQ